MFGPKDIKAAHARIKPYLRDTPVIGIEAGGLCDAPVALKLELFQHTGSFKARGGLNAVISSDVPTAGIVAASGGNHGAAIAFAASKFGVKSTVFAPENAGPVKIARMRGFGAEVIVSDQDFTGIVRQFEDFAKTTGALAVHPYNDPLVMTGQGTVGLEIEQQLPEIDTLFVSVGGGGLIGGITTWFGDRIKIVAVETEGTASLAAAYADGPEAFVKIAGISASSLGAPVIGCRANEILTKFHVQNIVVPDTAVFEAQKKLWDCARIVAEPGAATALAPLTSGAYVPKKDERVGVLVCGGNAQPDWFLD